jgi:hypothetical protein
MGKYDLALELTQALRRRGEHLGDRGTVGWAWHLTARALSESDPARALLALDQATAIATEIENPLLAMSSGRHAATVLIASDDPKSAESAIRRVMEISLGLGELDQARRSCAQAAITRAMLGDDETAAIIIGRFGLPSRTPNDRERYERLAAALAERLGDRHRELLERGRSMRTRDVIDLTLAALG